MKIQVLLIPAISLLLRAQAPVTSPELLQCLRKCEAVFVEKKYENDRSKIRAIQNEEDAMSFILNDSDFIFSEDAINAIPVIEKAAGFKPKRGAARLLMARFLLNSVRVQDSTIGMLLRRAMHDDQMFGPAAHPTRPPRHLKPGGAK